MTTGAPLRRVPRVEPHAIGLQERLLGSSVGWGTEADAHVSVFDTVEGNLLAARPRVAVRSVLAGGRSASNATGEQLGSERRSDHRVRGSIVRSRERRHDFDVILTA